MGIFHPVVWGTNASDFEQATKRIKEYLILIDSTLSKTGLDEGLNNQIATLSKSFYVEAKNMLSSRKENIEKLTSLLCDHKSLSQDDVKNILNNTSNY